MNDPDFVEATPTNGFVVHAIPYSPNGWLYPDIHAEQPKHPNGRRMFARALCGVRGRDATGFGGMDVVLTSAAAVVPFQRTDPNRIPVGSGAHINEVCGKCIGLVAKERADQP